jgi:cellulose synthase/poly-beta-1,6-N-acetylglucosamine synthase-like glycosyltransferase
VLFNTKKSDPRPKNQGVSIVIPFHNEALYLPHLLESIAHQDYKGPFEIVLVNDRSTDDFLKPIRAFQTKYPSISLSIIDFIYNQSCNLTSKQQALDMGISKTTYAWLAFTDADMVLEPDWLSSLMSNGDDEHPFVFGHTSMKKQPYSLFTWVQAYQLEFLFGTAFAFFSAGPKGSCMGNNILVSKKIYKKIGGQAGIGYSIIEDRDLMAAVTSHGSTSTPVIPFYSTAQTMPCRTFSQFFNQMLRWLKGGTRSSWSFSLIILLFGFQQIISMGSFINNLPDFINFAVIMNIILLHFYVVIIFKKIGSGEKWFLFPFFYIFLCLETLCMIIPFLFIKPVWKQDKLS